jgi:hypothetical protein
LTEPCCGSNGAWLSNTWTDSSNNLCWQDPPAASTMNWFVAAGVYNDTYNDTTEDYCGDLGSGWRLPTISELRSLVRSGTDTGCEVIEWDVSWSSVPAGYCRVWDSCLSSSDCYEYAECVPSACGTLEGPGAGGCYWDAALSGACWRYWSASDEADYVPHVLIWFVGFDNGAVSWNVNDTYYNVRCVRSGL